MGKLFNFQTLAKETTPLKIVLDTNFILNFTTQITKYPATSHSDCLNFSKSLTYAECEIFIPEIVINEFCCQIYSEKLREHKKKNSLKGSIIDIHKDKPSLIATEHKIIKDAVRDLNLICSKKVIIENGNDIRNKALELMGKYNMLPSDAYIASITIINEINNIATLDVPFSKSILQEKNVNIYTPYQLNLEIEK